MPIRAVPHRDTVTPPQLARDVPASEPAAPLHVGVDPPPGPERDAAIQRRRFRRALQLLYGHEPLLARDPRLDLGSAPVTVPDAVHVGPLDLHDLAHLPQAFEH